jgi:hypothetical protein
VSLDVEREPQSCSLDDDADHSVAAFHEDRDEVAGSLEDELTGRGVVARIGTASADQIVADLTHGLPVLVAHREPKVGVDLGLQIGQRAGRGSYAERIP